MSTKAGTGAGALRVAIVEDDDDQRDSIVDFLSLLGYSVWGGGSGEALDRRIAGAPVDVVVLDVGLPGEDGFSIARRLRSLSAVGIVMLTARDGLEDCLAGLDSGADSYLVKPLYLRELAANIDAVARRIKPSRPAEKETCWRLEQEGWHWVSPDGTRLKLTAKEYLFVRCLARAGGETVTRDTLAAELGGDASTFSNNRLDVLVSRLRKKGDEAFGRPVPVKAVTALGFALTAMCLPV